MRDDEASGRLVFGDEEEEEERRATRLEVGEGWEKTMLILLLYACLLCPFLCVILSCLGC